VEKSDQPDNQEEELAWEQMAERTRKYADMIGQDEPQDADESEPVEQREDPAS
jgi:hypothetical protein